MALDQQELEKPLRKLRKLLKRLPKAPSPEMVHELRTSTRRLEAIALALGLKDSRHGRALLKLIEPVRKKAGKVRDLDVFLQLASTLERDTETDCYVQFLEYVGAARARAAKALHARVKAEGDEARPRLKGCLAVIGEGFRDAGKGRERKPEWEAAAAAAAMRLSTELTAWPALTRGNLHAFRLKVKELRYLLQLAGTAEDGFVKALGVVKDAIGEWHDWLEMEAVAGKALGKDGGAKLRKQIRKIAGEKLDRAMREAKRLQRMGLGGAGKRGAGRPKRVGAEAMRSAARLTA